MCEMCNYNFVQLLICLFVLRHTYIKKTRDTPDIVYIITLIDFIWDLKYASLLKKIYWLHI